MNNNLNNQKLCLTIKKFYSDITNIFVSLPQNCSIMKTIEQTNKYLSTCIFDDSEWELVLSFCRSQYGGGKVHRPRRGQYSTSYTDFITWFDHLPGQGDIVVAGHLVGMVGYCTSVIYKLCAYIGLNGQLIQQDLIVYPHKLQYAPPNDADTLMALMRDAHVTYSVKLGQLIDLFIPDNGDFVMVNYQGTVRYGIFDRIEASSYLFYFLDNKEGKTSSVSVPILACEVETATSKQGLELLERLSHLGVMWSSKDKKLYPVQSRAEHGGKYWYINDKFFVCQAKDMHTPVHQERYKNGNYFTSYGEALVFLKRLKDLRTELMKQA